METLVLEQITCDTYRSQPIASGRCLLQAIGTGDISISASVDGTSFSQMRPKSFEGSTLLPVNLPIGGQMTVEVCHAEGTPVVNYIRG